jgi:hypothetical protein
MGEQTTRLTARGRTSAVATTSNKESFLGPWPAWVPPGLDYDNIGPEVRCTLTEVVGPLYAEVVAGAGSGWERATGMTYVHAVCLSLAAAQALGTSLGTTLVGEGGLGAHSEQWTGYLRTVALQHRQAKFHFAVSKTLARLGDMDPLDRVPR